MSRLIVLALCASVLHPLHAQEQVSLPGLDGPVEIVRAPTAVPTIIATTLKDAMYIQGYLHADERFFQMDFSRRGASGTVASLVGEAGLESDISNRTLGLRRASWRSFQGASDEMRALLRAYANGVNQWLATNPLPVEYAGLEVSEVPAWTPVDSLVVAKGLAFSLAFEDEEVDQTIALLTYQGVGDAVGFDGTALYLEDTNRLAPADDRVTVPGFLQSIGGIGQKAFDRLAAETGKSQTNQPQVGPLPKKLLRAATRAKATLDKSSLVVASRATGVGSNWKLIAPSAAGGAALYANDVHLSTETPSIFVANQLVADLDGPNRFNVTGAALPGVPGMVVGCNDNLCWGTANNELDVTDFFAEELRLNALGLPTHTIYQGEPERIQWIFQSYFVNQIGDGQNDNVARAAVGIDAGGITFAVPRRSFGPLVDVDAENFSGVSVQFTGFNATQEVQAFLGFARAQNLEDFEQALTFFDTGSQNFAVADREGNIAYYTSAEMPLREDLQLLGFPDGGQPPFVIRDGTGELMHEWLPLTDPQPNQAVPFQLLPIEEMPFAINPDSGYLANGNNDPIGTTLDNNALNQIRPGGGIYYLSDSYQGLRMAQIDRQVQDLVAADAPITAEDLKALQSNNQIFDAELLLPFLLEAFENATAGDAWPGIAQFSQDPRIPQAFDILSAWDFTTPTGIAEGYDPIDTDPFVPTLPDDAEIQASVATTIYTMFRSRVVQNTIDATLSALTLGDLLPDSRRAFSGLLFHLENFDERQGVGLSGINFFTNPEAPTPADARDFVLLASLQQALDLLASDDFAPAFANSTDLMDYRWGRLHRVVFEHPLGQPLSLPTGDGVFPFRTLDGLDGVARHGNWYSIDDAEFLIRVNDVDGAMFSEAAVRRSVATMAPNGIAAEQIIAGGQSGEITDGELYINQLLLWLINEYLPLFVAPEEVQAVGTPTLIFTPANAP